MEKELVDGAAGDGAQGLPPFMLLLPIASLPLVLEARNADLVVDRKDLDMVLPTHAIAATKPNGKFAQHGAERQFSTTFGCESKPRV